MVKVKGEEGSFLVMKYQVTQAMWENVTGSNPSHFRGASRPVEFVSWLDSVIFANELSEKEGLEKVYEIPKTLTLGSSQSNDVAKEVKINTSANGYRLPTEVEWVYAARGGEKFRYAGSNNADEVGWYKGNSGGKTYGVGQKKSNGYGLYDMSGNVFEWCFDAYNSSYRVYRGGGCKIDACYCGVSYRFGVYPSLRFSDRGVRLFRSVPQGS